MNVQRFWRLTRIDQQRQEHQHDVALLSLL